MNLSIKSNKWNCLLRWLAYIFTQKSAKQSRLGRKLFNSPVQ